MSTHTDELVRDPRVMETPGERIPVGGPYDSRRWTLDPEDMAPHLKELFTSPFAAVAKIIVRVGRWAVLDYVWLA
jgi:hypothetical protein